MHAFKKNGPQKKEVNAKKELRKHPRRTYKGSILYSTESKLYEGEVRNYSPDGIFVKTRDNFFVGQTLTLALPYSKAKSTKRAGMVIWQNPEGFGVEFISKR